jgi:GNAT superfamily N-acetyltransferase
MDRVSATIIRPATLADLAAMDALRRKEGDALGFIPMARYEAIITGITNDIGQRRADYEGLTVVEDGGELTGFAYARFARRGLKLEQVCIRHDARRIERATALVRTVEAEAIARGSPLARCRVGADLEAVSFWGAIGYTSVSHVRATFLGRRKSWSDRPLIHFERELCQPRLFPDAEAA